MSLVYLLQDKCQWNDKTTSSTRALVELHRDTRQQFHSVVEEVLISHSKYRKSIELEFSYGVDMLLRYIAV